MTVLFLPLKYLGINNTVGFNSLALPNMILFKLSFEIFLVVLGTGAGTVGVFMAMKQRASLSSICFDQRHNRHK